MAWITVHGWANYTADWPSETIDMNTDHIQSMRDSLGRTEFETTRPYREAQTEIVFSSHSFLVVEPLPSIREKNPASED